MSNVIEFQINSRRENTETDAQVIEIRVLRKVFNKQFCCIRCGKQLNRGGLADLAFVRTLIPIRQKF